MGESRCTQLNVKCPSDVPVKNGNDVSDEVRSCCLKNLVGRQQVQ